MVGRAAQAVDSELTAVSFGDAESLLTSGARMANVYWVTFRIAERGDYESRYENLVNTLKELSGGTWWVEPTSFALFASDHGIDTIAEEIKSSFDYRTDLALIGMPNVKSARAVGAITDKDLFQFMPFTKKV